jgi:hypothetical protein
MQLWRLVRAGRPIEQAAAAAGVSARSARCWRAGRRGRARAGGQPRPASPTAAAPSTLRSWRAAASMLERTFPEWWAVPSHRTVSDEPGRAAFNRTRTQSHRTDGSPRLQQLRRPRGGDCRRSPNCALGTTGGCWWTTGRAPRLPSGRPAGSGASRSLALPNRDCGSTPATENQGPGRNRFRHVRFANRRRTTGPSVVRTGGGAVGAQLDRWAARGLAAGLCQLLASEHVDREVTGCPRAKSRRRVCCGSSAATG